MSVSGSPVRIVGALSVAMLDMLPYGRFLVTTSAINTPKLKTSTFSPYASPRMIWEQPTSQTFKQLRPHQHAYQTLPQER
jgi:hypothetical protein